LEDNIETSNERSSLKEEGRGREKRMHNAQSPPPGVINTPAIKKILYSVSTDIPRYRNDEIHPAVFRCLAAEVLKQQPANENVPEIHVENPRLNAKERAGRTPPTGQEKLEREKSERRQSRRPIGKSHCSWQGGNITKLRIHSAPETG
jgi:hypothetical protein